MQPIEIVHTQSDQELGPAYAALCPVPPFNDSVFITQDDSEDSKCALLELTQNWEILWPKMKSRLDQCVIDYELDVDFSSQIFVGNVGRADPDAFMGDQAKVFVEIEVDELDYPTFDFFIHDAEIVHFQPVF